MRHGTTTAAGTASIARVLGDFAEGLRKSGALHSAQIVSMLALEWERMQMRG